MSRPKKQPTTCELPPFPALTWDGGQWQGPIRLNCWTGFRIHPSTIELENSDSASGDTFMLSVFPPTPPSDETSLKQHPCLSQADTFRFLVANEVSIYKDVIQAIFEDYNTL